MHSRMNPNRKKARILCAALLGIIVISLIGCYYVQRKSPAYPIERGSTVGVVAYATSEESALLMESMFNAALGERLLTPVSLRTEDFIPKILLSTVIPPEDAADNARLFESGEIEGDQATLDKILAENRFTVGKRRFEGLVDLLSSVNEKYGLNYVLAVHQIDAYCYVATMVEVATRRVSFSYTMCGNEGGWDKKYDDPPRTSSVDYRSADEDYLPFVFMQFAEDVVGSLHVVGSNAAKGVRP